MRKNKMTLVGEPDRCFVCKKLRPIHNMREWHRVPVKTDLLAKDTFVDTINTEFSNPNPTVMICSKACSDSLDNEMKTAEILES